MIKAIIKLKRLINGEIPISILVKRGLKVGKNFSRQSGCYIDPSHCFLISIGDNVTFSINVTLLAHDASMKYVLDYARIGRIVIGNNCFIGANTTILPGVTIGDNCIIGAGSIVTKSVEENSVYAGVPAKKICSIDEFSKKQKMLLENTTCFDSSYKYSKNITKDKVLEMQEKCSLKDCYIK